MQILTEKISREQLEELAANTFIDMIKCVADVEKGLLAVDAELHADLESMLLENGSELGDLWGFNLYPEETGEDFIEFDSLINIRSWQGNRSRDVENPEVREQIKSIVSRDNAEKAFERMQELIDLTITYGRHGQPNRKALLKELCRFRELYCGAFLDGNLDTLSALNRYLDHFAHIN